MNDPAYHTEFKVPLKDLRTTHSGKWVEVLVIDKKIVSQNDDEWDKGRVVARFERKGYADEAYALAVRLANFKIVWVGGVLIR